MNSGLVRLAQKVHATDVRSDEDALTVDLDDGRTLMVPILWYPRLAHASPEERANWELIGLGEGIHWPDLDEDLDVEAMVLGWRSAESPASLQRWLDERAAKKKTRTRKKASA